MFLTIPFILILFSLGGIFFVVWRKMPYLKKLTVEHTDVSNNVLTDFFPELFDGNFNIKVHQYKDRWLVETEKILRKLRLFFLRIDLASESLIKKIRRVYLNSSAQRQVKEEDIAIASEAQKAPIVYKKPNQAIDLEAIKKEEQRLIIEIAKNPKDPVLYEVLGDLYFKMKNFSDAKESYEAAVELNPGKEDLAQKLSKTLEKVVK